MHAVILDAATLGDADLTGLLNNGDDWEVFDQTTPEQVLERIQNKDIVLANKVPISAEVIEQTPEMKLIMITATGTNNVDLVAAKTHNKIVCNVRGYGSSSVAQHAIALMLNLATKMPLYMEDVKQGEWHKRNQVTLINRPIFELAGKRLGIVGYGQLGQAVAKLAKGFNMEILLAARPGQPSKGDRIALDELLPQIDFLSLHCPLDETNHHLIDEAALGLMSKNSFLINTSRGSLVDSEALIQALTNKTIAGAGLDVLPTEPPVKDEVLIKADLPNLIITPHNAWGAIESRQRLIDQVTEIITNFHGGTPMNQVTV